MPRACLCCLAVFTASADSVATFCPHALARIRLFCSAMASKGANDGFRPVNSLQERRRSRSLSLMRSRLLVRSPSFLVAWVSEGVAHQKGAGPRIGVRGVHGMTDTKHCNLGRFPVLVHYNGANSCNPDRAWCIIIDPRFNASVSPVAGVNSPKNRALLSI